MNSNDGTPAAARLVAESQSEMTEIILPNDTNTLGNLLGGRLMHFIAGHLKIIHDPRPDRLVRRTIPGMVSQTSPEKISTQGSPCRSTPAMPCRP